MESIQTLFTEFGKIVPADCQLLIFGLGGLLAGSVWIHFKVFAHLLNYQKMSESRANSDASTIARLQNDLVEFAQEARRVSAFLKENGCPTRPGRESQGDSDGTV